MQLAILSLVYSLPFFFQAVQGSSTKSSGLSILPFGITTAIATLVGSAIITLGGIYIPFMWLGAALLATGAGLLHTLHRSSPIKEWFGYQVISGIGFGIGVQAPSFAIQVVLDAADIPVASALIAFCQSLGGMVGAAVAQNVFQSSLVRNLEKIQGIDVDRVVTAGGAGMELAWLTLSQLRCWERRGIHTMLQLLRHFLLLWRLLVFVLSQAWGWSGEQSRRRRRRTNRQWQ